MLCIGLDTEMHEPRISSADPGSRGRICEGVDAVAHAAACHERPSLTGTGHARQYVGHLPAKLCTQGDSNGQEKYIQSTSTFWNKEILLRCIKGNYDD